jgi:hypothetical protein
MTVESKPLHSKQSAPTFSPGKVGAIITACISWLTTYWCVLWVMEPTPESGYTMAIAVAIVAELVLTLMKRCLFNADRSDDTIGWAGLIVDAVINAGGILPRAGKLLTFPPIAAILTVVGVNAADPRVNSIGAFVLAIAAGALLSVLPHRLWKSGD